MFPVLIGDAIHNMRAALDLMACDLVRLNGKRFDNVSFPFAQTASALEQQIKDKNFKRAHPDAVALLRSLKPYKDKGDVALRAIHDLDIMDKHQALLPAVSAGQTRPVRLVTEDGEQTLPSFQSALIDEGGTTIIVVAPRSSNFPVGTQIPANFSLIFVKEVTFRGLQVSLVLQILLTAASRVLNTFETHFSGQPFPTLVANPMNDGRMCTIVPGSRFSDLLAKLKDIGCGR